MNARKLSARIRQSFPKESNLADVTEVQVQLAVEQLNHRPRKVLWEERRMKYYSGWIQCE